MVPDHGGGRRDRKPGRFLTHGRDGPLPVAQTMGSTQTWMTLSHGTPRRPVEQSDPDIRISLMYGQGQTRE